MKETLGVCGVAIAAAFLALLLSEIGYKGARLLSVAASVILFTVALAQISDILSLLDPILSAENIKEPVRLSLKVVGIGYTVGVCRDAVDDLGHKSLASSLMTVGRLEILAVVVPEIINIVRLASSLI